MADRVIIGLTGGIASGKSTVSRILQSYGATIVDADKVGHSVYEPGTECLNDVVKAFGEGIILDDGSGKLNRPALGKIVFSSPEKLVELNKIVWPYINRELKRRMDEHVEGILVVEAAVMIEAGWAKKDSPYNEVWISWVSPQVAEARLMARNNFSAEEARKRINSQITNDERLKHANVAIENNGAQSDLEKKVREQWNSLIERYKLNYSKY
jgi:dephospho-CoA kinase|eukprot:g12629.t1